MLMENTGTRQYSRMCVCAVYVRTCVCVRENSSTPPAHLDKKKNIYCVQLPLLFQMWVLGTLTGGDFLLTLNKTMLWLTMRVWWSRPGEWNDTFTVDSFTRLRRTWHCCWFNTSEHRSLSVSFRPSRGNSRHVAICFSLSLNKIKMWRFHDHWFLLNL